MSTEPPPTPPIPAEFLVTRSGTTFIAYRGLIHLAHQQGLSATSTTLVQLPTAENGMTAIVSALVTTEKGTFSGLGDADPGNVPKMIAPHLIRMAETRALARALRVATNAAFTALEELGDDTPSSPPPAREPPASPPAAAPERIRIGDRVFSREEVWLGYQNRRTQALNAKAIGTDHALAGHLPTDPLRDLVASAQRLRKLLEPPPELEGEPEP